MCAEDLAAAFARHQEVFGKLDICINNAGLLAVTPFYEDPNWKKMVDVNLTAVIDGTGKAVNLSLSLSHTLFHSLLLPIADTWCGRFKLCESTAA